MAETKKLIDRLDTIRANSVNEEEFERVWGKSLDDHAKRMVARWDILLAQAKEAIELNNK